MKIDKNWPKNLCRAWSICAVFAEGGILDNIAWTSWRIPGSTIASLALRLLLLASGELVYTPMQSELRELLSTSERIHENNHYYYWYLYKRIFHHGKHLITTCHIIKTNKIITNYKQIPVYKLVQTEYAKELKICPLYVQITTNVQIYIIANDHFCQVWRSIGQYLMIIITGTFLNLAFEPMSFKGLLFF